MMNFVRDSTIGRDVFGAGRRTSLGEEIEWLGLPRLLILCSPSQQVRAEEAAHALDSVAIGVFREAVSHLSPALTARASAEATQSVAKAGPLRHPYRLLPAMRPPSMKSTSAAPSPRLTSRLMGARCQIEKMREVFG